MSASSFFFFRNVAVSVGGIVSDISFPPGLSPLPSRLQATCIHSEERERERENEAHRRMGQELSALCVETLGTWYIEGACVGVLGPLCGVHDVSVPLWQLDHAHSWLWATCVLVVLVSLP